MHAQGDKNLFAILGYELFFAEQYLFLWTLWASFERYLTRIGWSFVLLGWFIWKLFILKETPENAVKFNHGHGLGAFSWSYYLKWVTDCVKRTLYTEIEQQKVPH